MTSLSFNGSSSNARITAAVTAGYPCTMMARVNPTTASAVAQVLGLYDDATSANLSILINASGEGATNATTSAGGVSTDANGSVTTGAWNTLVGIMASATSRRIITNGGTGSTSTTSRVLPTFERTSIGSRDTSTQANYLNGLVSEVAIANTAWTDEMAVAFHNGWSPWHISSSTLVLFVPDVGLNYDWCGNGAFSLTSTSASADAGPGQWP